MTSPHKHSASTECMHLQHFTHSLYGLALYRVYFFIVATTLLASVSYSEYQKTLSESYALLLESYPSLLVEKNTSGKDKSYLCIVSHAFISDEGILSTLVSLSEIMLSKLTFALSTK